MGIGFKAMLGLETTNSVMDKRYARPLMLTFLKFFAMAIVVPIFFTYLVRISIYTSIENKRKH